jgi:hypothetical protein
MSLLTQKQIQEIIDMATQQAEFAEILKLKLDHWNSNQTNQHFEVNWKIAPKGAEEAILEIHWLDRKGDKFGWDVIAQYDRPSVAHPHAKVIMKYAEAAQRRTDPWVEFEIKDFDTGSWTALNIPLTFFAECEYRHIGDKP